MVVEQDLTEDVNIGNSPSKLDISPTYYIEESTDKSKSKESLLEDTVLHEVSKFKKHLQPLDEEEDTPYSDDFDQQEEKETEETPDDSYTEVADSMLSSSKRSGNTFTR